MGLILWQNSNLLSSDNRSLEWPLGHEPSKYECLISWLYIIIKIDRSYSSKWTILGLIFFLFRRLHGETNSDFQSTRRSRLPLNHYHYPPNRYFSYISAFQLLQCFSRSGFEEWTAQQQYYWRELPWNSLVQTWRRCTTVNNSQTCMECCHACAV